MIPEEPTYQWYHNGASLPGATAPTLTIPSAYYTDAGTYSVTVSNRLGGTNSQPATLTVLPQPLFANLTNGLVLHLALYGDYRDS
jgi:PKD repeat protein